MTLVAINKTKEGMRVTRFVIVTYAYRLARTHADHFIVVVCCNRLSWRCGVIFCADKNAFVRNNIVKEPFSSRQENNGVQNRHFRN